MKQKTKKDRYDEKKLDKLIEEATVDCYNDYEARSGFGATLEDELTVPFRETVLGEDVVVNKVKDEGDRIVAVIRKNKELHKAGILDLKNVEPAKHALWIEAYRKFLREC